MAVGALEFIVVGFPGKSINSDVASGLTELVRSGVIRIVDMLFIQKDADGTTTAKELDELDPSDSAVLASIVQEMDGLIAAIGAIDGAELAA